MIAFRLKFRASGGFKPMLKSYSVTANMTKPLSEFCEIIFPIYRSSCQRAVSQDRTDPPWTLPDLTGRVAALPCPRVSVPETPKPYPTQTPHAQVLADRRRKGGRLIALRPSLQSEANHGHGQSRWARKHNWMSAWTVEPCVSRCVITQLCDIITC